MLLLPPAPTTESLRAKLGKSYAWVVLMVISAGGIATVLATTGFAVAIPSVMQQFHVGNDVAQLSMSAYMAAMTIALLPAAWMYERFGLRRCFLVAVGAMLVSSIVGAYSTSFSFMVAMRIAQGVTAGVTGPMGIVAVMRLFPPERQGRAWGVIGFATVLAPAIAPALGGAFVDAYGWQSIFWINVPFCIVALISAFFLLPYVPPRTERGPDWIGLLLLAIASVAIIALATFLHSAGPLSWQVLTCAVTGTLATGTFLLHAKRIDNPIVSPRILQNPRVAAGAAISLTYGMGLYGSTYLIPLFMQSALGFSAADSGMALLPAGITLAFMILIGGWWVDHGSPRLIATLGTALFGASFFVMWMFAPHLGYWGVATAAVVSRIGLGILLPALNIGAMRGLEGSAAGQSSVFLLYLRLLGGMVSVAAIAVYIEWRSQHLQSAATDAAHAAMQAFSEGFLIIALIFGVTVFSAMRMPPREAKQH